MATSNTAIKITSLPNIGNNIAPSTLIPVVNMAGVPVTQKANLQITGNLILAGAGTANFVPARLANLAYSVVNAAQPNITSVGTLTSLTIGNFSNLHIPGGTNGQYLQTDGTGNLAWVSGGGSGNGVVGGSNTQIQFNNAGNFGGSSGLTWNGSTGVLSTLNLSVSSGATIYGNTALTNLNVSANFTTNNIYTDNYYYANGDPFIGGTGITGITVKDEGTNVVASANTINFIGAGVTASNVGGVATITIDGGGGNADTGNVTFDDQVVVGTGSNDGSGGLYLAPSTTSTANLQYLRVRGGDVATHIHLDTGDNGYFDQYFGDDGKYVKLESGGNISIETNTHNWTFGLDGNLLVPGNIVGPANANVTIYANAGVHEFTFSDDGTFYAPDNVVLGGTSISIGPGANTLTGITNAVFIASSNSTAYIQAAITNVSDIGSADWAAYGHRGDDSGGWIDMGFNSSGYNGTDYTITGPGDGSILTESYYDGQSPGGRGGNLIIATGSQGTVRDIIFGTGGFLIANEFARISDANNALELTRANASIAFNGGTDGNINSVENIKVISNSNTWTFGTDGNLTLPGNLVIAGNTSVFGTNAALIQPTDDLPLLSLSSGANAGVSSIWVEDIANVGSSNIAAVYANPIPGSGIVRIAVGQNGGSGPNLWDFNANGTTTFPGDLIGNGASPAPSINGFNSISALSFAGNGGNITYQQTNTFYVDPGRTQNYTPTGTVIQPFFTVTAAISAAVTAGYTDSNPAFVLLLSNITEDITMQPGIFLTSFGTGTHGSPNITGTITVSSSSGTISSNHYSISNLRLIAPTDGTCIDFTGSAAQRLFIRDVWLDTNGSGTCIFMDNSNTTSVCHLNTGHLAHSGTGDIYCIDLTVGSCYITDIETSGNVQVAAVRTGTVMTIDGSEIDANNNAAIEVYGGSLTVTNSIITNAKANSNGVALNTTGSVCTLLNVLFSVPTGSGKAVFGTTTSLLYYLNVAFAPGSNTGKTAAPALIATVLGTTWS